MAYGFSFEVLTLKGLNFNIALWTCAFGILIFNKKILLMHFSISFPATHYIDYIFQISIKTQTQIF